MELIHPPIPGYEAGRPAGSFSATLTWNTLQGESNLPPGIQNVEEESVLIVPRGLGVPELYVLANGTSLALSTTFSYKGGNVSVALPIGSKLSFIGTSGNPAPSIYVSSPGVFNFEVLIGADNTYSPGSQVVNGYWKIGVPYVIDHDMINRVVDSTPQKKNCGGYAASAQIEASITPDQVVKIGKRRISLSEELTSQIVVVYNEEYENVVFSGTGVWNVAAQRIQLSGSRRVNLTEIPSVSQVPGYEVFAVCIAYGTSGVSLVVLENPPATLQGVRLPAEYQNLTWMCSIMLSDDTANIKLPAYCSLIIGETMGVRAAVAVGLKGNRIYCTGCGMATVPDGEEPIVYSVGVPPNIMSHAEWYRLVESYNQSEGGKLRIEFSQTGQLTAKRQRDQ